MGNYVCAFRGRRDNYQVPLALAEAGRLDRFITDAYVPGWLPSTRGGCTTACALERNAGTTMGTWHSARTRPLSLGHNGARALKASPRFLSDGHVREARPALFSRCGRACPADENQPAALRALRLGSLRRISYPRHTPRKVLFQYHPHTDFENRLLTEDFKRFPEIGLSYAEATGCRLPASLQTRIANCWRPADLILCASTFTRHTMLEAGADFKRCAVVPYGIEMPPLHVEALKGDETRNEAPTRFRALFVGSGVQRKGLHHLLHAWHRARLPAGSELTLVCRNIDPGLQELVARKSGDTTASGR